MPRATRIRFVRQQGFRGEQASSCALRYPGLMFQPRLVGLLLLIGIVLQEPWWFAGLGALLLWGALLPRRNLFDFVHDALLAGRDGRPELGAAPPPRRFAQGLAGSLMLVVTLALSAGWREVAWGVEGFLVAAVGALVFGKFCLGSFLFHHLRGEGAFARRTAPWASGE